MVPVRYGKSTNLFEFGYGLNYASFEFSPCEVICRSMNEQDTLRASVEVRNIGERAGTEVVQMYIRDCYSSVVRPLKELKGFS